MEPDRASQPLSTAAAIGLAGLTAAAVLGGGVLILERRAAPRPPAPAIAQGSTMVTAPPAQPTQSAPPRASIEPPAVEVRASSSAPSVATSAPTAAPVAAASLPPQVGYLVVHGQGEARVYVNGVDVGTLNAPLKAPCGLKYVRLGTASAGGRPPTWLSPGQSVSIGCRAMTEISAPSAD